MGKGKNPSDAAQEHQAPPLSTLKDPASFPPPPKHIHYHGAAAASSPAAGDSGSPPFHGGSARQRLEERRQAQARAEEEQQKPPAGPYRADTTGLSTANLPKPPVFRGSQRSPSSNTGPSVKPKLPPRLPPRQNSNPNEYSQPPPPYSEIPQGGGAASAPLNQVALDRLGRAGISVPALDINRNNPSPPIPARPSPPPRSPAPDSPAQSGRGADHLGGLQSKFSRLSTSNSESRSSSTGTSWEDKQAAIQTANALRNGPSNASISDVQAAASTANKFRERHGEQAASSWRTVNNITQQHGVTPGGSRDPAAPSPPPSPSNVQAAVKKKPPPPPPPKKKLTQSNFGEPPPIPLGSKPRF
jgi:hypothetical protein